MSMTSFDFYKYLQEFITSGVSMTLIDTLLYNNMSWN